MATPKRKRFASTPRRNVRRRLFSPARSTGTVRSARKRTNTYSSRSERGNAFGFRTKMLSPRVWRKKLWDSTLQKSHYRSVAAVTLAIPSPAGAQLAASYVLNAMDGGAGLFWTASGGAIDVDGGTMPTFTGDLIIRGGKLGVTLSNQDATSLDLANVDAYLYEVPNSSQVSTTGIDSLTRPFGWDPSLFPEINTVLGHLRLKRSFILKPGEQANVEYRLKVKKIDREAWLDHNSGRFFWLFVVNNPGNGAAVSLNATRYFNLSFAGDVQA